MYIKVASQSPRLKEGWRDKHIKRTPIEEFFKSKFGAYPTSENEINQFRPYFKEKKADNYLNRNI